jgi:hypothetical protein
VLEENLPRSGRFRGSVPNGAIDPGRAPDDFQPDHPLLAYARVWRMLMGFPRELDYEARSPNVAQRGLE